VIGLTIRQAQSGFFDRSRVIAATSAAERRVLSRFGAFVRQRARTSMRRSDGTAPPGSPPYAHTGLLRTHLYFAWDGSRRSVVVGPARLNQKAGDAPRVLEYGGVVIRRDGNGTRVTRVRPRPFMVPAFNQELQRLPPLWRSAIR